MSHKKHFIVYTKALKQNWRDIYNSAHNPSIIFQSKKQKQTFDCAIYSCEHILDIVTLGVNPPHFCQHAIQRSEITSNGAQMNATWHWPFPHRPQFYHHTKKLDKNQTRNCKQTKKPAFPVLQSMLFPSLEINSFSWKIPWNLPDLQIEYDTSHSSYRPCKQQSLYSKL